MLDLRLTETITGRRGIDWKMQNYSLGGRACEIGMIAAVIARRMLKSERMRNDETD